MEQPTPAGCAGPKPKLKWTIGGGVLALIGLCAACCALPFVLIAAGVGSVWAGAVEELAPYRTFLIAASGAAFAFGFYAVYLKPKPACGPSCEGCPTNATMLIWLWAGAIVAAASLILLRS